MKPNKETYRILVIDDHPIVAEGIIALASQLEGVTCKGATCAKDVEQLTLKERFDLCIIDLELPDMNGFQLISHLHSQIPECGILIYTMHEEPWIIAKLDKYRIMKQRNWQCDITPAVEELGFSPEYDLERGVKETIAWYKDKGWL